MKKNVLWGISVILLLMLTGCGTKTQPLSQQVLQELCSQPHAGRLVGTQGNERAAQYLAQTMEQLGIEPYQESFLVCYQQVTADPNEQNTQVTVTFADGSSQALVHGKDFYTNAANRSVDATFSLAFSVQGLDENSVPVATQDQRHAIPQYSAFANPVFFVYDEPTLVVGSPEKKSPFQLYISAELAQLWQQKQAQAAHIKTTYAGKLREPANVVGVLRGAGQPKRAVVLTAHFDHVGQQGKFFLTARWIMPPVWQRCLRLPKS